MIEILIGVAIVCWAANRGDKAVKDGVRKAEDFVFSESDKLASAGVSRAKTVLQPCKYGSAPHQWPSARQAARTAAKSDGNGILPDACSVCGETR